MKIDKILIELEIEEKINKKYGIYRKEIENALYEGNALVYKAKKNKYLAIAHKERYITIIFNYEKNIAKVITAYQSSNWQIKLYKKRK